MSVAFCRHICYSDSVADNSVQLLYAYTCALRAKYDYDVESCVVNRSLSIPGKNEKDKGQY